MSAYIRKVQYHETDKMGITHHSNYIKWMEEARIWFLEGIGYSYGRMESDGMISPVTAVECKYKQSSTFDDEIAVRVWIKAFSGVRLIIGYEMKNTATGLLVAEGHSEHCFTNPAGRPIALKRQFPELDRLFRDLAAQTEG